MTKMIEEILAPKPEARPHIYAYSISDDAHQGLLKVGQTTRDYTGIETHPGLTHYGLYDTVVARE